MRRFLIHGLKKEFIPFVTSIQGWAVQPSVEELESLLSNQEALAKQMGRSVETESALFTKGKYYKKHGSFVNKGNPVSGKLSGDNSQNPNPIECYRCGKTGHIKKNCRVKLSKVNVANEKEKTEQSEPKEEIKWEQCFTVEVRDNKAESEPVPVFYNHSNDTKEWILDSGCSHHVTGDESVFTKLQNHDGERVIITADNSTYPVAKEGTVEISSDDTKLVKLDNVYHVPGLQRNLVSVSQITNSGKYVLFGPNDVKILDNVKNLEANVVFTGEKKDSMFVMSVGEAYVKKTSQIDKASIWHARLGHLSYPLLQQISSHKLLEGMPTLQNNSVVRHQENVQLSPEHEEQFLNDVINSAQGDSADNESQGASRSTRERRQPSYLQDYERLLSCVAFGELDEIASVFTWYCTEISDVKDSSGLWGGSN
ncbi:CCHC-type domain-containing protein [Heracleum sosnowskyi]|uniref:CCHC-type domain-containing protein n=1 Tax=Heracleum sosnowskyi TaxID=360622 RepID=A0AAD8HQR8_9APIA|nr:CCHC-type domain-containing protein [Heracleum sosnowskyi]